MENNGKRSRFSWRVLGGVGAGVALGLMLAAPPVSAHFLATIAHIWLDIHPKVDRGYATVVAAAASSVDIDDFTTATFTSILSTSITAPRAGFLMITGSLGAADDHSLAGVGTLFFRVRLDATAATNDDFANPLTSGVDGGEGNTGSTTIIVPVTAGAHTVSLDAREYGTGSYIYSRNINAIFFPKGSGVIIPFASGPKSAKPQS